MLGFHLHFIRPWWLLALIPWLLISLRLFYYQKQHNHWQNFCDPHLLPHIIDKPVSNRNHGLFYLLSISTLLLIIATSGPAWNRVMSDAFHSQTGVVYLVDMSSNMQVADIKPTRLQRSKFKLIDLLKGNDDLNVGMVAFAGEAYTVSPLTTDSNTIASMLADLSPSIMPIDGHNFSMGLNLSAKLLQQAQASPQNIVVVTSSNPSDAAIDTARKLAAENIHISVLSIGTETGGPIISTLDDYSNPSNQPTISHINTSAMQQLASAGNGIYIPFTDNNQDTAEILHYLLQQQSNERKGPSHHIIQWHDEGQWFILLAALLACFAFRKTWFEEIAQ